jgi:hypothetical protein
MISLRTSFDLQTGTKIEEIIISYKWAQIPIQQYNIYHVFVEKKHNLEE